MQEGNLPRAVGSVWRRGTLPFWSLVLGLGVTGYWLPLRAGVTRAPHSGQMRP